MNKLLIICLFVLGLLTLTACSHTSSNTASGDSSIAGSSGDSNIASSPDATNVGSADVSNNFQKISDIQKPENVGKIVTVQGKVVSTMRSATFHISGYKIQDSTGTIDVSSPKQPQVNTTVTVTGNLYQSRYFGIVINETG